MKGLLVDGVYRVLAWVVSVMLPPMAIFFPLFTLLEDLGYLPRLSFNLSHSEEQIAFAFSFSSPVGIDIEKIRENARSSHLVHRFFHPDEELRFAHLPELESTQLFFRYWTIREAFLKGIGTGFTISADSFRIDEIDSDSGLYQLTKYPLWRVQTLPAPDKYFCSVAYCIQNPL